MAVWLLVKGFVGGISPTMWKYIAIAMAFGAVFIYADRKATYRERAACEAAAKRAQVAADAQDTKAGREQLEKAKATVETLSAKKVEDDAIIEHLKVELAKRPLSAPCYYPDVAPTGRVRPPATGKGARN